MSKNTFKSWSFKAKPIVQTTSEQLENNFQKVKCNFKDTENCQKITSSEGQNFIRKFDIGQLSTFRTANKPKICSFMAKNYSQTNSEKLENNVQKD